MESSFPTPKLSQVARGVWGLETVLAGPNCAVQTMRFSGNDAARFCEAARNMTPKVAHRKTDDKFGFAGECCGWFYHINRRYLW